MMAWRGAAVGDTTTRHPCGEGATLTDRPSGTGRRSRVALDSKWTVAEEKTGSSRRCVRSIGRRSANTARTAVSRWNRAAPMFSAKGSRIAWVSALGGAGTRRATRARGPRGSGAGGSEGGAGTADGAGGGLAWTGTRGAAIGGGGSGAGGLAGGADRVAALAGSAGGGAGALTGSAGGAAALAGGSGMAGLGGVPACSAGFGATTSAGPVGGGALAATAGSGARGGVGLARASLGGVGRGGGSATGSGMSITIRAPRRSSLILAPAGMVNTARGPTTLRPETLRGSLPGRPRVTSSAKVMVTWLPSRVRR